MARMHHPRRMPPPINQLRASDVNRCPLARLEHPANLEDALQGMPLPSLAAAIAYGDDNPFKGILPPIYSMTLPPTEEEPEQQQQPAPEPEPDEPARLHPHHRRRRRAEQPEPRPPTEAPRPRALQLPAWQHLARERARLDLDYRRHRARHARERAELHRLRAARDRAELARLRRERDAWLRRLHREELAEVAAERRTGRGREERRERRRAAEARGSAARPRRPRGGLPARPRPRLEAIYEVVVDRPAVGACADPFGSRLSFMRCSPTESWTAISSGRRTTSAP